MGFQPTKADQDVWIRPAIKPDGFEYYEMVITYIDDVCAISHKATAILEIIQQTFKLKNDKIAKLDSFLGATLEFKDVSSVRDAGQFHPRST